jgi:putative PIN family toxin of toxin-antitoxin system
VKVVLDTNVVVSAYLAPRGPAGAILRLAEEQRFTLAISSSLLEEYERVLNYPHLQVLHRKTAADLTQIVVRLAKLGERVTPVNRLIAVAADPDDDKFLACAIEAGARLIVSGDKHLLDLGSYEGIQILPVVASLRLFDAHQSGRPGNE